MNNASRNGYVSIVERLFQHPCVCVCVCGNPSAKDNEAIHVASEYGHVSVVKRFLQDFCV
jgi:hypothetical protein